MDKIDRTFSPSNAAEAHRLRQEARLNEIDDSAVKPVVIQGEVIETRDAQADIAEQSLAEAPVGTSPSETTPVEAVESAEKQIPRWISTSVERLKLETQARILGYANDRLGRDEIIHLRMEAAEMDANELKTRLSDEYPYPNNMDLKDKLVIDRTRTQAARFIDATDDVFAERINDWRTWEFSHRDTEVTWFARKKRSSQTLTDLRERFMPSNESDSQPQNDQLNLAKQLKADGWDNDVLQHMRAQYRRSIKKVGKERSAEAINSIVDPFIESNVDRDATSTTFNEKLLDRRIKKNISAFLTMTPQERRNYTSAVRLLSLEVEESNNEAAEHEPIKRKLKRLGGAALGAVGVTYAVPQNEQLMLDIPVDTERTLKLKRAGRRIKNGYISTLDTIDDRGSTLTAASSEFIISAINRIVNSAVVEKYNTIEQKRGRKNTLFTLGAIATGVVVVGVSAYALHKGIDMPDLNIPGSRDSGNGNEAMSLNNYDPSVHMAQDTEVPKYEFVSTTPDLQNLGVADTSEVAGDVFDAFENPGDASSASIETMTSAQLNDFNSWVENRSINSGDSIWKFAEEYLRKKGNASPSSGQVDAVKDAVLADWRAKGIVNSNGLLSVGDTLRTR